MLVIGSTTYCALRCSRAAGYPSPPLRIDGVKVRTSLLALIVTAAAAHGQRRGRARRSEEHTSELQSPCNLVCRLLLEKKKKKISMRYLRLATNSKYDIYA